MKPNELTLGDYLRTEREKKGISLEQLASATKVNIRLLSSLENDDYSELPAKPFIRGFVISYCRFVGLDSNEVLTFYRHFMDKHAQERPDLEKGHRGYAFERKETERSKAILWAVMGSFVVLGGVMIFILKPALKHRRMAHVEALREEYHAPNRNLKLQKAETVDSKIKKGLKEYQKDLISKSEVKKKAEKPINLWPEKFESAEPFRVPSEKDALNKGDLLHANQIRYKLVLKAKQHSWVRYQVDDLPIMTFILRKSRILVLRANRSIKLQTPHPDDLLYRTKGRNYLAFEKAKGLIAYEKNQLFVIPQEILPKNRIIFPGYSPLPLVEIEINAEQGDEST